MELQQHYKEVTFELASSTKQCQIHQHSLILVLSRSVVSPQAEFLWDWNLTPSADRCNVLKHSGQNLHDVVAVMGLCGISQDDVEPKVVAPSAMNNDLGSGQIGKSLSSFPARQPRDCPVGLIQRLAPWQTTSRSTATMRWTRCLGACRDHFNTLTALKISME